MSESIFNLPRCGLCGAPVRQGDIIHQNRHIHEECYAKVERETVADAGDGRDGTEARSAYAIAGEPREGTEGALRDTSAVSRTGEQREGVVQIMVPTEFLRGADPVQHPAHYGGDVPHEVIKCLQAWGLESDALLWNAVKYIARSSKKGAALQDLEKARFYLDRKIATLK